jgi:hypothetical protein
VKRPEKITPVDIRAVGVRALLVNSADYRCGHSIAVSADPWPDDLRLSDLSPRLCAKPAAGAAQT